MIDDKGRYVLENYAKKSVFSSFLPGISGITGIPIWCYYTNRGQAITCFGSEDKEHAIMEFLPAHQAYIQTGRLGYRTFLKVNGSFMEAFTDVEEPHKMVIDQNMLEVEETNHTYGLCTHVTYYTLPEEKVGALVREVTFTNIDTKDMELSFLDGAPAIVPYGVDEHGLKHMTQTAKAWMQVEDVEKKEPFFRVRASMEDSSQVVAIEGGNFSIGVDEAGNRLQPIVDTDVIFDFDTAYVMPYGFLTKEIEELLAENQMTMNRVPCCFYAGKASLKPGQSITIYEVTGQSANKDIFHAFQQKSFTKDYFTEKKERAVALTKEVTKVMETGTASKAFDAYCRQNFLDNVLRGGMPISLGEKNQFYVYARKHGDMERDYNFFRILPEFYSQGNGNFRDVNQNRRCDAFFYPKVADRNIQMFYDFIQLDGYNPLGVEKTTYQLRKEDLPKAAALLNQQTEELTFLTSPYTPGKLAAFLAEKEAYTEELLTKQIGAVTDISDSLVTSDFLEGYWCDHWTYNLDLIESYLAVHPEKEYYLLYEKRDFVYMKPGAGIYPRKDRYVETPEGIRQYKAVYPLTTEDEREKRLTDSNGTIIKTNLMEKLLLLNTVKFATLDAYGCGIEMEGGKPGWYDALNGLPGLLGSSMPETCELARNLHFTLDMLKKYKKDVMLLQEIVWFMEQIGELADNRQIQPGKAYFDTWDRANQIKEAYREKLYQGISGKTVCCKAEELISLMERLLQIVEAGILYAKQVGNGLLPTYFSYEVTDYEKKADGIYVKAVEQHALPYFLEGPVRYLKLPLTKEQKEEVYCKVKECGLYDEKLGMYKVNTSLAKESYALGRCRAFTPGWLENESIWLHMEYKYLLELLKAGLYEQFLSDFHQAAVPFLREETYGRSILENSSFLASSANPDEKVHGKGFVARLSGSTVEFMDIWQTMLFGRTPFQQNEEGLVLELMPLLPAYLIREDGTLQATFMGKTKVTYQCKQTGLDYIPGSYQIKEYQISNNKGKITHVYGSCLQGQLAEEVRAGKIAEITVYIEKN